MNFSLSTFGCLSSHSRFIFFNNSSQCAIDLLKLLPDNNDAVFKFLARQATSITEINDLHIQVSKNDKIKTKLFSVYVKLYSYKVILNFRQAGLPEMDACETVARQNMEAGRIKDAIKYFIISNNMQLGLELGLHYMQGILTINVQID